MCGINKTKFVVFVNVIVIAIVLHLYFLWYLYFELSFMETKVKIWNRVENNF